MYSGFHLLSATLWHTLALPGSLLLSNFAYTALDRLTGPLLGSHRRCHDDALYPALDIYGFVKGVTWICQSCYIYYMLLVFSPFVKPNKAEVLMWIFQICICISYPLPNQIKFYRDFTIYNLRRSDCVMRNRLRVLRRICLI